MTSPRTDCGCRACPETAMARPSSPEGWEEFRLRVEEMDCPTEESLVRKALKDEPLVVDLVFDLVGRVITIHHQGANAESIEARIRSLGMTPRILEDEDGIAAPSPTEVDPPQRYESYALMALAGLLALGAELAHWFELGAPFFSPVLALSAIGLVGLPTWRKGLISLRHGSLNINALMTVAVTGALLIGQFAEAAMVLVLFTLAERLEAGTLDRARRAIRELLDLAPRRARVLQAGGGWEEVAADGVTVGSVVRVRAGERVALDGTIACGNPSLDESPITGESLPKDKSEGDEVFAGTINRNGEFDFRTTKRAGDTTLSRIIHAVEKASSSRAPTHRMIDRFAAVYTPVVFGLAVAAAVLWPLLFSVTWLDGIYRGLILLVIACPCALVISTPVTIVGALSSAARAGILIKGGSFLELGHRLDWLAFDKTGTLTTGRPRQLRWLPLASDFSEEDARRLRRLAAGLASRSNHPLSLAVFAAAIEDGVEAAEATEVVEQPGLGVRGKIDNEFWWLGGRRLAEEQGHLCSELKAAMDECEGLGEGVVVLGDARGARAIFSVADTLKETGREAVDDLHRLGVRTLVLSGDNPAVVEKIAKEAGIDETRAHLLPEDKLAAIEEKAREGVVGMVGDGINDAPALARADIGFAMGAFGSDAAIETADVALMDDDPRKLGLFVKLSHATRAVLIQNIAFSIGIKVAFMALALGGLATLWMAVLADMGVSLLVVANALRLTRLRLTA